MLLVQDGKLSVSDPVGKHIPDAPAAWKGITIRHLLTHTAGLVREAPGVDISRFQPDIDVIRRAYGAPLHFAPQCARPPWPARTSSRRMCRVRKGSGMVAGPGPPLRLVANDRIGEDVIRLAYVPA